MKLCPLRSLFVVQSKVMWCQIVIKKLHDGFYTETSRTWILDNSNLDLNTSILDSYLLFESLFLNASDLWFEWSLFESIRVCDFVHFFVDLCLLLGFRFVFQMFVFFSVDLWFNSLFYWICTHCWFYVYYIYNMSFARLGYASSSFFTLEGLFFSIQSNKSKPIFLPLKSPWLFSFCHVILNID